MRIWCFAVRVYFPTYCFTFDRNLPRQSCQALGNCLFSLPWQLLVRRAALAHSLMLLLSALCSRQDTTCIQHFFSFSHLMHVYTYIYMWQCKCTVLWHSASAEMDRVLFIHLPALVSLFPSKKCSFSFFLFPLAPSHYINLPSACGCFWFWQIKLGCQSNASLLYPLAVLPVTGPGALCHSVKQYNNLLFWSDVAWGRSYRKEDCNLITEYCSMLKSCLHYGKKKKSLGLRLFHLNLGGNTASSKSLFYLLTNAFLLPGTNISLQLCMGGTSLACCLGWVLGLCLVLPLKNPFAVRLPLGSFMS